MRVVLRLKHGPKVSRKRRKNQQAALVAAGVLTPAALMAGALALWRIGTDMSITGQFPIAEGLFSHWQIWFAVSIGLQALAVALSRYGNTRNPSR
jgi:hypothetical protein